MFSLVGYLASVLLALSLLVNNDLRFRWLNTFGCLAFIIYGVLIHAFPILLTNSLLLVINLFYLFKIYRYRAEEDFDLIPFQPGDLIVKKFLSFYSKDIEAYFPRYRQEDAANDIRFVVLRDMAIANIFIAHVSPEGNAEVKINYTVPKFRDYKVGRFIFDKEKNYLLSKNVKQVSYTTVDNKKHEDFLKTIGFVESDGAFAYRKELQA
jgi:hypothetical protein